MENNIKVLIVNIGLIGDTSSIGSTMKNMLHGIHGVDYMQLCVDYRSNKHTIMYPTLFLKERDMIVPFLIKSVIKKCGKFSQIDAVSNSNQFITNNHNSFKNDLYEFSRFLPTIINRQNLKNIRQFKPDMIYTMGGDPRVLEVALRISKKSNIPMVFHCMDDWPSTVYTSSKRQWILRKRYLYILKQVISRNITGIAISEKMADVYEKRYNIPFSVASNCVNIQEYCDNIIQGNIKVIYSGGLHAGRDKTLAEVGKALEEYKDRVIMHAFVPPNTVGKEQELLGNNILKVFPYVPKEQQLSNLQSANILLHVESFDEKYVRYFSLSFSTKIAEYLSVGRPIIGYGPPSLGSLEIIEKYDVGWVAHNQTELQTIIDHILMHPEEIKKKSYNAYDAAHKLISKETVQNNIYNTFKLAMQKHN